jgi:hypothetical protein
MRDGFAALPTLVASAELERRVLRRVARERDNGSSGFVIPLWGRAVGLAAAAALLILLGVQALERRAEPENVAEHSVDAPAAVAERIESNAVTRAADEARLADASPAPSRVAAPGSRSASETRSVDPLDALLGQDGVPLTPLGSGRTYVIDRPADLPIFGEGADGEPASSPITF